jgi:hypothetical protein
MVRTMGNRRMRIVSASGNPVRRRNQIPKGQGENTISRMTHHHGSWTIALQNVPSESRPDGARAPDDKRYPPFSNNCHVSEKFRIPGLTDVAKKTI